jgi:cell division protein FtsB
MPVSRQFVLQGSAHLDMHKERWNARENNSNNNNKILTIKCVFFTSVSILATVFPEMSFRSQKRLTEEIVAKNRNLKNFYFS